MATVKFLYRSAKDRANLKLRFRHNVTVSKGEYKNTQIDIDTDVTVSKDLFKSKQLDKSTKRLLEDISEHIIDAFNSKQSTHFLPSKDWLIKTYEDFNSNSSKADDTHLLSDWIDRFIEHLEVSDRQHNRIKAFRTYKNKMIDYDSSLEMHELSLNKMEEIYIYLIKTLKHSPSTAKRMMRDLKLVGSFAIERGATLGDRFQLYKLPVETKSQLAKDHIKPVILTEDEIQSIIDYKPHTDYLINARKWVLLAIYTGQRGEDVLSSIVAENFSKDDSGRMFITFTQAKTGERMKIPALKVVREIYDEGLPHPISLTNFNKYLKEVCKNSGITEVIEHKKSIPETVKGTTVRRTRIKALPKYDLIASHSFRRTFCSLYYGRLSNIEIMKISGHRTEREFLKYIGEKEQNFSVWDDE